ncbi:MAG: type II secretion system F family protein [Neomegalonema sp.]|nr:type II secretion system F family protein [Neomegalonema sp.]
MSGYDWVHALISDISPPTFVAGMLAALSIFAFYSFIYGEKSRKHFKRRMADVKENRAQLRASLTSRSDKGEQPSKINSSNIRAMREKGLMDRAVEKLNLAEKANDSDLKLRLARAGLRRDSDVVRFVFLRIALPLLFALAAAGLYALLLAKSGGFKPVLAVCFGLVGGIFGFLQPSMRIDGIAAKRKKEIIQHWPDALDLLTICVESGMSIEQAFNKVAEEMEDGAVTLAEELKFTTAELSYLGDRRRALENLALRTDAPAVKAVVSALVQADKYGTPVASALRVISAEGRFDRLAAAEAKAAALPAKLTVPMMVFFLPVLFIVILGPSILQVMDL